jgi:hypothetical protein
MNETTFFYLDAHLEDDLPLREESEIIVDGWTRAVVLFDHFRVPDDPGYSFDDYDPGKVLNQQYLPPMVGWQIIYPAARASAETGVRRGSCCLVSPALVFAAPRLTLLRTGSQ